MGGNDGDEALGNGVGERIERGGAQRLGGVGDEGAKASIWGSVHVFRAGGEEGGGAL